MSFSIDVEKWADSVNQALREIAEDVVVQTGESVVEQTPVVTGRLKGNWLLTLNTDSNNSVLRYDGAGSATLSDIRSGASSMKLGDVAYISNNVLYGPEIEYNGVQNPAGMVRVTADKFEYIVQQAVEKNT